MARRKQADTAGSLITLGGTRSIKVYHELGMDMVQSSRMCKRTVEIAAESRSTEGKLTELHRELMYLERVALQPDLYPEVKGRPLRRISGYHLHEWAGKRLGMGVKDVAAMLDQVEVILRQNARAEAW